MLWGYSSSGEMTVPGKGIVMDQDQQKKLQKIKEWEKQKALSQEEKRSAKLFLEGKPVINIPPSGINLADNSREARNTAKKEAIDLVRTNGEQVISTPEADVIFNTAGVKKSLGHTIDQEKIDTVPYIPEGISKGITIDISKDFDKTPLRNIHKALPVKTNSGKDLLMIRSRQAKVQDANFYNHHLFNRKELKEKGDTAPPSVAGPGTNPGRQSARAESIAHIKNILHDILNVKEEE